MVELQVDSSFDLIPIFINPSAYPIGTLSGDLLEIKRIVKGKNKFKSLLYKVPLEEEVEVVNGGSGNGKRSHKSAVIVSGNAATALGLKFGKYEVELDLIIAPPAAEFCASYVELFFNGTYLSRPDMFRLTLSINQSTLFQNQRISFLSSPIRLAIGTIYNENSKNINSGYINKTKIIFRSESSKSFIFIEISKEFWQFEEDGVMLTEKCESFLRELFSKNQNKKHLVTIVIYGRVIYEDDGEGEEIRAPLLRNSEGLVYRDFYKVILDPTVSPPISTARLVTLEIQNWQKHVLLRTRPSGELKRAGRIAFAHESNFLEAVNLGLNTFVSHFIDRDLQRTGLSLIVVSAGCSFYHVDKELLRLTTERILSLGLAIDLIALSKTPLHSIPLFSFYSQENDLSSKESILYFDSPINSTSVKSLFYYEPLFIFCSFFGDQIDKPHRIDRFLPRARMYELFSQGVGGEKIPISIEPLKIISLEQTELDDENWQFLSEGEKRQKRRDEFDNLMVGAKNGKFIMNFKKSGTSTSGISDHSSIDTSIVSERKKLEVREDRGRERRLSDHHRIPSSTRSRTPMRRTRAPSVTSVTTISSKVSLPKRNISSTPSLISRLTAVTTTVAPEVIPPVPSFRPSWLGIFRGATTTISPSVGISKVSTLGNEKSMESIGSIESPNISRRSSTTITHSNNNRVLPTLPISIGSKTVEVEKNNVAQDGNNSLTEYGPVEETKSSKRRNQKFNPSKLGKKLCEEDKERARRWSSLFIRHRKDETSVNWTSICQPACLPLISDYLPSIEMMNSIYTLTKYSISLESVGLSPFLRIDNEFRSKEMELVEELICQRLSHGFQICYDNQSEEEEITISEMLNFINEGENGVIHLSLGNQIHSISYNRRTKMVNVSIYIKKSNWLTKNFEISGLLWTSSNENFQQSNFKFSYPTLINSNEWEQLDNIISGLKKIDSSSNLRYWKTRLVLLPSTSITNKDFIIENTKSLSINSTDDEIRSIGFNQFIETLNSLKYIHPSEPKEQTIVQATDLSPIDWARKVSADQMRLANQSNVPIQRSSRWLKRPSAKDDLNSILSVERERTLSPDRKNLNLSPTTDSTLPLPPPPPPPPTTIPIIEMSHSIILDLDLTKKSKRAERILCHLDKSHNSTTAYHLELNWLGGSGKLIEVNVGNWIRNLNRFGLSLMEVSCRDLEDRWNPFFDVERLEFKVGPPDSGLGIKNRFTIYLLTQLGFYLDLTANSDLPSDVEMVYSYRKNIVQQSQFIHQSGTVIVSILPNDEGLSTSLNRNFISHQSLELLEIGEIVMKELRRVCDDEKELIKIWDCAKEIEL